MYIVWKPGMRGELMVKPIRPPRVVGGTTSDGYRIGNEHGLLDLTGMKFGKWTVIKRSEQDYLVGNGKMMARWDCECGGCGNTYAVLGNNLRAGVTQGCQSCATLEQREKRKKATD